jgi:hypothetical protein
MYVWLSPLVLKREWLYLHVIYVCMWMLSCNVNSASFFQWLWKFSVAWYFSVVWVGSLLSKSMCITCLWVLHATLISVKSVLFIQSMLSRSFNSNFTAVSSSRCGSSRDLHGSQGSLTLSVADGRGSGGHVFRVSTYARPVLLVHRKLKICNVLAFLEKRFSMG